MRAGTLTLLLGTAATACSYDWTVGAAREGGADDGPDATSAPDGALDAGIDGSVDASSEVGPRDARTGDAPPDCSALQDQVQSARALAIVCTEPEPFCNTIVQDQCDCGVVVSPISSAQKMNEEAYVTAVAALVASGCPLDCSSCPGPPQTGFCLPAGDGGSLACSQSP